MNKRIFNFAPKEHLKREWEILVTDIETGLPIGRVSMTRPHLDHLYLISHSFSTGRGVLRTKKEVDYIVGIYNAKTPVKTADLTPMITGDRRLIEALPIFEKISNEHSKGLGWLVENWQPSFEYPNLHVELDVDLRTVIIEPQVEKLGNN